MIVILFRGFHKFGSVSGWVYGYYSKDGDTHYIHSDAHTSYSVDPDSVGQSLCLKDKNKKDIYVGDIVEGYRGFMKGDGYLKKGYPKKVRIWLQVIQGDGRTFEVGYQLDEIKYHPDDKNYVNDHQYRSILYRLHESRECFLQHNEIPWKGCNEEIEVIGNKFENPELLYND